MAKAQSSLKLTAASGSFTSTDAAKLGNQQSGSVTWGPLKITWNLDISIPQIAVDAYLNGISIGHAVINPANPTITLGGSIGIATAELILTADFTKKEIDYDVDVELLGYSIVNKKGKLFTW
jgi:hypothetical protein